MRQIVVDTETTGLLTSEGHRIIEVGCVEIVNRYVTGKTYHQYICPQRSIDPGALAVHGITETFLADKPLFKDVVHDLLDFIKGAELIIHNAAFDVGFLNYELQLVSSEFKPVTEYCQIFDTLLFARKKHPGQQNSLDALCKRYNVDNSNRDLHGALLDANLLAEVYLTMTGGQTSLFVDAQPKTNTIESTITQAIVKPLATEKLKVIHASTEELQAHQARLAAIKKVSGVMLWDEEKQN